MLSEKWTFLSIADESGDWSPLMLEDIGSNVFDRILTFTRRRRKVITVQFFQVQIWFSFLFLFLFLFHFFLLFTVVKLFFNFINRVRNLRWFNLVRKEIAGYWLLPQFKIACAHLRSKLLGIFIFDRVVTLIMDFNLWCMVQSILELSCLPVAVQLYGCSGALCCQQTIWSHNVCCHNILPA